MTRHHLPKKVFQLSGTGKRSPVPQVFICTLLTAEETSASYALYETRPISVRVRPSFPTKSVVEYMPWYSMISHALIMPTSTRSPDNAVINFMFCGTNYQLYCYFHYTLTSKSHSLHAVVKRMEESHGEELVVLDAPTQGTHSRVIFQRTLYFVTQRTMTNLVYQRKRNPPPGAHPALVHRHLDFY